MTVSEPSWNTPSTKRCYQKRKRRLPEHHFDWLAAVLFDEGYGVARAALVPHALVLEHSAYQKHPNGWRFMLRDEVRDWPGVRDVTDRLRAIEV